MKTKTHIAILLIMFAIKTYSQTNLVPNPSFEIHDTCPNQPSQLSYAVPWFQPSIGSPDYFNACALDTGNEPVSVPKNVMSYHQYAHTGNAYSGIIVFGQGDYREYVEVPLTNTLVAGTKYYVTFYVALADTIAKSTSTLGLLLTSFSVTSNNYYPLPGTPQINNPANIFFPYTTWTKVSGSYIATGGEKYITIGNFDSSSVTHELLLNNDTIHYDPQFNYLFLDDFCVSTDSVYANTWTGIQELNNKQSTLIKAYPNPANDILNINAADNIEQVQLVNSIGQVIYTENTKGISSYSLTISSYPNGIYIVRIKTNNGLSISTINIVH
jgi:hypothetical protein